MKELLFYIIGPLMILSYNGIQNSVNKTNQDKPIEVSGIPNNLQTHNGINIINTGPRGGAFINSDGNEVSFRLFRVQIINNTIVPVNLKINFPEQPISLLPDSSVKLRLFLCPDSITPKNIVEESNFGVYKIEDYLNAGIINFTNLENSIRPQEHLIMYIGMLFKTEVENGLTRARLFINGQDVKETFLPVNFIEPDKKNERKLELVYGIGVDPPNYYTLISCGQIEYEK